MTAVALTIAGKVRELMEVSVLRELTVYGHGDPVIWTIKILGRMTSGCKHIMWEQNVGLRKLQGQMQKHSFLGRGHLSRCKRRLHRIIWGYRGKGIPGQEENLNKGRVFGKCL